MLVFFHLCKPIFKFGTGLQNLNEMTEKSRTNLTELVCSTKFKIIDFASLYICLKVSDTTLSHCQNLN